MARADSAQSVVRTGPRLINIYLNNLYLFNWYLLIISLLSPYLQMLRNFSCIVHILWAILSCCNICIKVYIICTLEFYQQFLRTIFRDFFFFEVTKNLMFISIKMHDKISLRQRHYPWIYISLKSWIWLHAKKSIPKKIT